MAKSPVIQMQNWFISNQHQWWCGPGMGNGHHQSDWMQYAELVQDATGIFPFVYLCILYAEVLFFRDAY